MNMKHWDKNDPTFEAPNPTGDMLKVIGNTAYGYNFFSIGQGDVAEEINYFDFHTGAEVYNLKMVGGRNMKSGAECTVKIQMNGFTVYKTKWDNGASQTNNNPMSSFTPFISAWSILPTIPAILINF